MGVVMEFIIRESVTDQDKHGKAYVHYTAWNETYTGLMPQEFLDGRSLEKCIKNAYEYPKNTFVAVAKEKVVGFALYIPESESLPVLNLLRKLWLYMFCRNIRETA